MSIKRQAARIWRSKIVKKPPVDAYRERDLGDMARNRMEWQTAILHYRRHLHAQPNDFAIWVQLGHALKESGLLSDAAQSYERALNLNNNDADLLIQIGHLNKLNENYAASAEFYEKAARLQNGGQGLLELNSAQLAHYLTPEQRSINHTLTKTALQDRLNNITLTEFSGISGLGDDRYALAPGDPWIEFKLESSTDCRLGKLVIKVDPEQRATQALYLDYGEGFNENYSFELPEIVDGLISIYIAEPHLLESVRWDPDDKSNTIRLLGASYEDVADIHAALREIRASVPDTPAMNQALTALEHRLDRSLLTPEGAFSTTKLAARLGADGSTDYETWLRRWVTPNEQDYARIQQMTKELGFQPKFSFVMPVYDPPLGLLAECIDSMLSQTYQNFEICIADDRSTNPEIRSLLESYRQRDERIKLTFRKRNGHISAASNSALALATGDFIVLMDHDDLVPDFALFVVAHAINENPNAQVLFSDEDKIRTDGERFEPYFKGDFDPYLMFAHNMVSHLGVYRRDLVEAVGGFRRGLEGSQDYDLVLRAMEKAGPSSIIHIPHILYHWRAIPGSTSVSGDQKSYAIVAAQQALNGHFERSGLPLRSVDGAFPGVNAVKPTKDYDALISIIIPTRDGLDDLRACISSIRSADHSNVEILIVDNGSKDQETLAYFKRIGLDDDVRILEYPYEFNFSEINNFAVTHARGEILCFLNNDTEVLTENWLTRARSLLAVPGVGIVGAKLLYPDRTIQHFGVIAGFGRHRVAGHAHLGLPQDERGYAGKAVLLQQFSAVTAACLFIKTDLFQAINGFDPELRVAYNDVDLCLKARAAGSAVLADPEIVLIHKESKSRGSDKSGLNAKRLDDEATLMRDRWGTQLDSDPFYSPNHDLDHGDYRFAQPPRRPMPWRVGDHRSRIYAASTTSIGGNKLDLAWSRRKRAKRKAVLSPFVRGPAAADIGVIVIAAGASKELMARTLDSLSKQELAAAQIVIQGENDASAYIQDRVGASGSPIFVTSNNEQHVLNQLTPVLDSLTQRYVLIMHAGDELENEALARFDEALHYGAQMAYCDEMIVDELGDTVSRFVAKTVFSRDNYLTRPYFDRGVAIDREVLIKVAANAVTEPITSETDLVLRCIEHASQVAHIPAFLYRTAAKAPATDAELLTAVKHHLMQTEPHATATAGLAPGSLRIDYPDDGERTLIVIPTKDGVELLRTCIESIRRTNTDADIAIIDHQSVQPETLAYLETLRGEVTIIPYEGKFNYAHMNNVAVSKLSGDYRYVVFMNNDVEVIEAGWLARMRSLAGRSDVGVVGATLLYANRTIQHSGVTVGIGGCAAHAHAGAAFEYRGKRQPGYGGSLVSTREYSAVTAACMMMRMEVFLGVGGFDEQLAVGFNDTDLCLRVGSLGYKIVNDAHTVLYHHESATRSQTDDLKHPADALFFQERWKMLISMGDPFYNPLMSLAKDHELADITHMGHAVRIRPAYPTVAELELGRPSQTPAPYRYH